MDAVDFLEEAGFEAIEAAHADEAISILKSRHDIAVVFTDIEMPGSMDGMKLAHAVRLGWGRKDRLCLPRQAARAHKAFPSARLHWFSKCSHFPMWDRPDETVKLILDTTGTGLLPVSQTPRSIVS